MQLTPKLAERKIIPLITLADKYGEPFNFAKQRGRSHFVLLVFASPAPELYLRELADRATSWQELPARGIVIVPNTEIAGSLGTLPFTLLIDDERKARDRFLPEGARAGAFILDRYGELYQQWLAERADALPPPNELADWVEAISRQCSI